VGRIELAADLIGSKEQGNREEEWVDTIKYKLINRNSDV